MRRECAPDSLPASSPSIREQIEADLALAEQAGTAASLDAAILGHINSGFSARARAALPDYASRLLRVLDLYEQWDADLGAGKYPEELRRAIEGGEG